MRRGGSEHAGRRAGAVPVTGSEEDTFLWQVIEGIRVVERTERLEVFQILLVLGWRQSGEVVRLVFLFRLLLSRSYQHRLGRGSHHDTSHLRDLIFIILS